MLLRWDASLIVHRPKSPNFIYHLSVRKQLASLMLFRVIATLCVLQIAFWDTWVPRWAALWKTWLLVLWYVFSFWWDLLVTAWYLWYPESAQLHDHIYIILILEAPLEADDVGMIESSHHVHLELHLHVFWSTYLSSLLPCPCCRRWILSPLRSSWRWP